MTSLGKPLVFHLKYMAEMNRLYGDAVYSGKEPDLTGLENAEHVQEMARTVGAVAYEQAADFLELCGKGIEDHFGRLGIATLSRRTKRASVVKYWSWRVRVGVDSRNAGWFTCGVDLTAPPEIRVSLASDECGIVGPWLWTRGGKKGEDAVWKILGRWAHSRGGKGLWQETCVVALACIPVKLRPEEGFEADREPLFADVMKIVSQIGVDETIAIASYVAGLKEPGEG
jgi:hypothetical protein